MKNLQKNTLKKILEAEQLSISQLSRNIEINRGSLSKLLNHNTQLKDDNWEILKGAYPEHVFKIETPTEQPKSQASTFQTEEEKAIKTKEENRHRNLNCPESHYHMKVPYRDLLRARPLCPLTQLPMMLKEEIKTYKNMSEEHKAKFIESLKDSANSDFDLKKIKSYINKS